MHASVFTAKLEQLHPMLNWIRAFLVQAGFSPAAIRKAELASEEALVNIIRHGYATAKGRIEIEVATFPQSRIEITIKDEGLPFNPLSEKIHIDRSIPLEKRKAGGLGIFLMRKYMDEVFYRREKKSNILTLVKKIL
jgi:serine/threonine-protein kinase RsbW